MNPRTVPRWILLAWVLVSVRGWGAASAPAPGPGAPGVPPVAGLVLDVGGRSAKVTAVEVLPLVENEYSRRYRYDAWTNPKLRALREGWHLDRVIAPGRDEFDRQLLLLDWVHRQFPRFGRPSTNCHGAVAILGATQEGHTFFCSQYAEVLVSTAASLGWVNRPLALRMHRGAAAVGGSTEHSVTEIWSNQHRKWVMLDPTSNLHVEREGVPLNAVELRQEWFYRGGTNLVFVAGPERKRYRRAELPIHVGTFPGFGELAFHPDEPDKYGFIGFIPNTDLMDSVYDYGKMFIVQDALCDGTRWHVRTVPADPLVDPYFPIGQAAITVIGERDGVRVGLRTLTPNFERFETRQDSAEWREAGDSMLWNREAGRHRLEVRTVNRFGVRGPVSWVEMEF